MNYKNFSQLIHDKALQNKLPIDGSFEITYRCNLKCIQCYISPMANEKNELSVKEISKILDDIAISGCLWLLITGGEPLIRKDFKEIFLNAKKKGFIVTLFTNGTLITEEIAGFFKEYPPFYIELTMYGASKKTYEAITGVKGSYEKFKNGIVLLKKYRIPFRLKTLLMKLNEHELPDMSKFAKGLKVEFRFDPIINPRLNKDQTPCSYRIEPERIAQIDYNDKKRYSAWLNFLKEHDKKTNTSESLRDNSSQGSAAGIPLADRRSSLGITENSYKCGGGWVSFNIDPSGKISPCMMIRENRYDLRKISFEKVWKKFSPEYLAKSFMTLDKCKTCNFSVFCDRCPGMEFLESENNDKSKYACQVADERAKLFACSHRQGGKK